MTAIAGVFGAAATDATLRAMLARMGSRGTASGAVALAGPRAMLAQASQAGSCEIMRDGHLAVAADATLYYRDDLRAGLTAAGIAPAGSTDAHLLLAAYRAWGTDAPRHLEGDYAFILWDAERGTVFCARDGIGLRPLHYGMFGGTLVVASGVAAVLAHPNASSDLNVSTLAAAVAGQHYSLGAETSFAHVHVLHAGHAFAWSGGALPAPRRHWTPGAEAAAGRLGFGAAAEELRERLTRAVAQRLPEGGPAAVWMSGGWDSTSVFAAGREALRRAGRPPELRPVCISYPQGDPGREDELIAAVLQHWGAEATWLDSRRIPLLEDAERSAALRDEAPGMLYAPWNGALAAASRASGAAVALDGNGGDQLFGPAYSYLSHLLASLRWAGLVRELWGKRRLGWRELARRTLLPLTPAWLLPATAWLRPSGRALRHYLERPLPEWVRADAVEREGVVEREQALLPRPGVGAARRECEWMFTAPWVGYGMSRIADCALAAGVELRSPLLDPRLVALALARPWSERGRGRESKRLLRAAMRDLLPPAVLAPRARRTGVTVGYSRSWMRDRLPPLVDRVCRTPLELEALGLVTGAKLRAAADRFRAGWIDDFTRVHLYHAIEVELWLRARRSPVSAADTMPRAESRDLADAGAPRKSHMFHLVQQGG